MAVAEAQPNVVVLPKTMAVGDLARALEVSVVDVIRGLVNMGVMASINQTIDFETASLVANELGFETKPEEEVAAPVEEEIETDIAPGKEILWTDEDSSKLKQRPPVVTVLGHVDHGKTSLLDAIRLTNVTAREAGGITQHIGAYQIEHNGRKVTFLDTPGHEAFTAMRARGAQVTDVAVLVVAADDGVQPQTVEAISHVRAAGVPIVVALNKIDRPDANADQVKAQLAEHGVTIEEYGGDTPLVPVSAKTKQGIEDLVEVVMLVADVADLKADPDRPAIGRVIEAHLDKGRGPVATVLVQTGTLERGDLVVAGTTFGKVRAMVDDKAKNVGRAEPSRPVEILGLPEVPEAGDVIRVVADEKAARALVARNARERAAGTAAAPPATLDEMFAQVKEGKAKELKIVLKRKSHRTRSPSRSSTTPSATSPNRTSPSRRLRAPSSSASTRRWRRRHAVSRTPRRSTCASTRSSTSSSRTSRRRSPGCSSPRWSSPPSATPRCARSSPRARPPSPGAWSSTASYGAAPRRG